MRGQNNFGPKLIGGCVAQSLPDTSQVNFLLRVNALLADTAFALTLYILHKYGEMFLQF